MIETNGKPQIKTNNRQLREVMAETYDAINNSNTPPRWFDRGGTVTQWRHGELQTLDRNGVLLLTSEVADWVKLKVDKDDNIITLNTFPPETVIRAVMGGEIQLPKIRGVIRSPQFVSGGELVSEIGYHAATGWLYNPPGGFKLPKIATDPTQHQIDAARELLFELLCDFPFVADSDRANAIGLILLPFVKGMISGNIPPHLIDAPTEGTGKSLLAKVISVVATGREDVTTLTECEGDEYRKQITAVLMQSPELVLIDNCNRAVSSAALAALWTSRQWSDRVLGYSRGVTLANDAVWMLTGNNFHASKEVARRLVLVGLDAKLERPDERQQHQFRHPDLVLWAKQRRPELVGACLTLVSAWIARGQPSGGAVMGSFEEFCNTIGGILGVAGVDGFLTNRDRLFSQINTSGGDWALFVGSWLDEFGITKVKVSQLVEMASDCGLLGEVKNERAAQTKLGYLLAKKLRTISGQHQLLSEDGRKNVFYWLEPVTAPAPAPTPTPAPASPAPAPVVSVPSEISPEIAVTSDTLADITRGQIPYDLSYKVVTAPSGRRRVEFDISTAQVASLPNEVRSAIFFIGTTAMMNL